MIVAMFLFFGGITFMGALFSSAGGPKSQQLRVLGEAVREQFIPAMLAKGAEPSSNSD